MDSIEKQTEQQPSILPKPHAAIPPLVFEFLPCGTVGPPPLLRFTSRRRCVPALSPAALCFIKASRDGAEDRILVTQARGWFLPSRPVSFALLPLPRHYERTRRQRRAQ